VETILKDISERALGKGNFSYSRFFAIGLFRLLELANATEPTLQSATVYNPYGALVYRCLNLCNCSLHSVLIHESPVSPCVWVSTDSVFAVSQLCAALNINKRSVDRDLDVYRNLLSKLVQAKELLKEYVDR
ncbi:hypothetical protein BHE74_00005333, partial [Ensete ventricosum]